MLRRVETLLAVDTRRLMGGTFHSVGNRLLRRFGSRVGLAPNFTILDPEDAREMLEAATSDRKIPTLERRFPKGDVLLDLYSFTINTGRPFTEVLAERAPHFSPLEARDRLGLPALPREEARRQRLRLRRPAALLEAAARRGPGGGGAARGAPTTTSSWTSTRTPTASRARSWTAWRGSRRTSRSSATTRRRSTPSAALPSRTSSGFPERYPDAKTFRLTRNYRSTPEILALANASIAHNARQFPKELAAARPPGPLPGGRPAAGHPRAGALRRAAPARVARRGGEALGPRRPLPRALPGAGAPDRADAPRDSLRDPLRDALLRAAARQGRARVPADRRQPEGRALLEAGPEDLSARRGARRRRRSGKRSADARTPSPPSERVDAGASSLRAARPRRWSRSGRCSSGSTSPSIRSSPAEAIRVGRRERLPRLRARQVPQRRRAPGRPRAVRAVRADATIRCRSFLEEVTLFNELSGEDVVAGEPDDDRVVLSSVHQAKGLEWSRVIVMWLSEGRFPSYRAGRHRRRARGGAAALLRRGHAGEERGRARLPDARPRPLRRRRHPGALAVRHGAARGRLRAMDRGARADVRRRPGGRPGAGELRRPRARSPSAPANR